MIKYFLILLLSHLTVDFVLQTDALIEKKNSLNRTERLHALLLHAGSFLAVSCFLFYVFNQLSFFMFWGLVLLSLSHYLIDGCKSLTREKLPKTKLYGLELFTDFKLFIIDQALHISFIMIFIKYYCDTEVWSNIFSFIEVILGNEKITTYFPTSYKMLFLLCVIIIITSFSNIFIRFCLSSINTNIMITEEKNKELIKIGRYIGGLERILTVLALMAQAYEALVALYAAKTAIRFGKAQGDPGFAEYYILGTSISALCAILVGLITKAVLGQ